MAILSGLIAAGAAIGGAAIAKSSANKAADKAAQAQTQAADQSAAVQREQMDLAREIYGKNADVLAPFVKMGNVDDSIILNALGLRGGDGARAAYDAFRKNTGYDWQLAEGQRAINGNYAGSGTFKSGARDKALMEYGQGLASSSYNDWLSRVGGFNDTLRGFGLSAASAQAGVGQNFVGNMGNSANALSQIYGNRGDALANAALVKAQNSASFGNTVAGALGQLGGSFLNPVQPAYRPPNPYGGGYTYNRYSG